MIVDDITQEEEEEEIKFSKHEGDECQCKGTKEGEIQTVVVVVMKIIILVLFSR